MKKLGLLFLIITMFFSAQSKVDASLLSMSVLGSAYSDSFGWYEHPEYARGMLNQAGDGFAYWFDVADNSNIKRIECDLKRYDWDSSVIESGSLYVNLYSSNVFNEHRGNIPEYSSLIYRERFDFNESEDFEWNGLDVDLYLESGDYWLAFNQSFEHSAKYTFVNDFRIHEDDDYIPAHAPEPSTLLSFLIGGTGMFIYRKRKLV